MWIRVEQHTLHLHLHRRSSVSCAHVERMLTQTDMPRLWGSQEISIGTCKLRSQQLHHSQLLEVSTTELAMSPALVLTWCRDDNRNWNNINRRLWDCGSHLQEPVVGSSVCNRPGTTHSSLNFLTHYTAVAIAGAAVQLMRKPLICGMTDPYTLTPDHDGTPPEPDDVPPTPSPITPPAPQQAAERMLALVMFACTCTCAGPWPHQQGKWCRLTEVWAGCKCKCK